MPTNSEKSRGKIRVLMAGHLPPPVGGISIFFTYLLGSTLPQKVDLRFVITQSKRKYAVTGRASYANLLSAAGDIARFGVAAIEHRPQVCHIATAEGVSFLKHSVCVLIARVLGSRVLLHPHCSLQVLYTQRPGWWQTFFRQVIRLTDGVIALSEEWKALQTLIPGCVVYSLPNGIDLSPYKEIAKERTANVKGTGVIRILYLGHLGKEKGSFDLVDAAQILLSKRRDISVYLVGEEANPGERGRLREKIDSMGLGDCVHLDPPAYDQAKMEVFRLADLFVYPSYHEGMPMAIIEAMACGLPTVASRVGGIPDLIIEGTNGYLIDPGQPEQIADALNTLCADNQLRNSMQQQSAHIAAERFNIEDRVDQLVGFYQSAIDSVKKGRSGRRVTSGLHPDHLG